MIEKLRIYASICEDDVWSHNLELHSFEKPCDVKLMAHLDLPDGIRHARHLGMFKIEETKKEEPTPEQLFQLSNCLNYEIRGTTFPVKYQTGFPAVLMCNWRGCVYVSDTFNLYFPFVRDELVLKMWHHMNKLGAFK